jgi:hypothetical protein
VGQTRGRCKIQVVRWKRRKKKIGRNYELRVKLKLKLLSSALLVPTLRELEMGEMTLEEGEGDFGECVGEADLESNFERGGTLTTFPPPETKCFEGDCGGEIVGEE